MKAVRPPFSVRFKEGVFQRYLLLGFALAVIAELAVLRYSKGGRLAIAATIVGGLLGFLYFVQHQRLAELTLFRELFTNFNERYEKLNDRLEMIRGAGTGGEDAPLNEPALDEYFNLCAEEFFYYQEGLIPEKVWRAWLQGMRYWARESDRIRARWLEEIGRDSYYGFPSSLISDAGTADMR